MKSVDDCTYREMIERYRADIHRHGDERTIYNMHVFMRDFSDMEEHETIREYDARKLAAQKERIGE